MKFKSLQKKKRAGFTLVEMVIVVTILGILSGIGFMKFGNVQETSRKNADYAAAANLATAANLYLLENPNIDVNNKTISNAPVNAIKIDIICLLFIFSFKNHAHRSTDKKGLNLFSIFASDSTSLSMA